MIDKVLDTIQDGNESELISLLAYQLVPCGDRGPVCPQGALPGFLIAALPHKMCGPAFETPAEAPGALSRDWSQDALYAATSLQSGRDGALIVLTGPDGSFAMELEDGKIVAINSGCGPSRPDSLFVGVTNYLLPPP